jgi:carboxyl-terminal processing protease
MAETPLRTDALMSRRTRLLVLLVSTPLVAFAIIGGLLGRAAGRDETYQHLRVFEDVVSLVESNYVESVDMDRVMEGAMRGLADGLDADTSYLTAAEVRVVESGAPLPEGDTGVEFTRQYYLRIVATRDGSPAARAGLRTGDYVRAIDGRPTRDMSVFEGGRLMHGPVGSRVTLTVIRGNAAEPHEVELAREKVTAPAVTSRMAAPGVGLVRIAAFPKDVAADVQREVAALERDGATHLLVDLRGTATGQFDAALAAARVFVPSGTLAQRESRDTAPQMVTASGQAPCSLPVTLLTTAGTSGPAELLVAALVGNKRADQVGERTLGRASEQRLVKLPDGSGLWLTAVRYLTPEGKAILGAGLEPTEAVEEPDTEFGIEPPAGDPILEKALDRVTLKKAA